MSVRKDEPLLTRTRRSSSGKKSFRPSLDFLEDRCTPTLFTVDALGDVNDGNFGAGQQTLREAVDRANANNGPDQIAFAATLNTQAILLTSEIALTDTTGTTTITGNNATNTFLDGNNATRVLRIAPDVTAEIFGVTIRNGSVTGSGGGIRNQGTLLLEDSAVRNNTAIGGGGDGGGIHNVGGNLTVRRSTVSNNSAGSSAGGIGTYSAGSTTLENSTISENQAVLFGGGLDVNSANLIIRNCTIVKNTAQVNGGGTGDGGGISVFGNTNVLNSIVAGNHRTAVIDDDIQRNVQALSNNNLIGDPASAGGLNEGVNGNRLGNGSGVLLPLANILNPTLSNNGGQTLTHALVTGSRAIDAGDVASQPSGTDQAGLTRNVGTSVDIGAVEFPITPIVVSMTTNKVTLDENAAAPGNTATLTLTRTGSNAATLDVNLGIFLLEASAGDFTLNSPTGGTFAPQTLVFTFSAGSSTGTLALTAVNDAFAEGAETLSAAVLTGSGYTVGSTQFDITISANDVVLPTVSLVVTDAAAKEDAASPDNQAFITLTRTGDASAPLEVVLSQLLVNGATAGDFTLAAGSGGTFIETGNFFLFNAGSSTATLILTAVNDTAQEGQEAIGLTIQPSLDYNSGPVFSGTLSILASDAPKPTVTISAQTGVIDENAGHPATQRTITLTRTGATTTTLAVPLNQTFAGADAADFTFASGVGGSFNSTTKVFTFNAGSATATFQVRAINDTLGEDLESMTLAIPTNPTAYTLGSPSSATVSIAANDAFHVAVTPISGVNNLVFTDITGTRNNRVTLSLDSTKTKIVINDPSTNLTTNTGVLSQDQHTVTVPLTAFNGPIRVNTKGGDDVVTIDESNGLVKSTSSTSFLIDTDTGTDTVAIKGDGTGSLRFLTGVGATASTSGTLSFTPTGGTALSYTLSSVDKVNATNLDRFDLVTRGGEDEVTVNKGTITGTSGQAPFIPVTHSGVANLALSLSSADVAGTINNTTIVNGAFSAGGVNAKLKSFTYSGGAGDDFLELQNPTDMKFPVNGGTFTFNGGAGTHDGISITSKSTSTAFTLTDSSVVTTTAVLATVPSGTGPSQTFASFTGSMVNIEHFILIGDGGPNSMDATRTNRTVIMDGKGGDDILKGGGGRDIIIGGLHNDTITGGGGDDILIAGTLAFAADSAEMGAIVDEWLSTAAYATRVNHLKGTATGGLNGDAKITTTTSPNDDSNILSGIPPVLKQDVLTGEVGNDWFFAYLTGTKPDKLADRSTSEILG